MFYSSYSYIIPSLQKDDIPTFSSNSIFLKQPCTFPADTDTVILSNSILYALDRNITDISEICEMIHKLISAQHADTSSIFFGLFPYFSPLTSDDFIEPDYDFQPLVLLPLLECYIEFNHLFPEKTKTLISESLTLATNILSYSSNLIDSHNKLLEIILIECVGEFFSIPQFIHSAENKISSYFHLIKYNRDMPLEYNSPELIVLQLEAITHFATYIENENIKKILNDIRDILLSVFYRHFNPHLLQWTGPFSLYPEKFDTDELQERIQKLMDKKNLNSTNSSNDFSYISSLQENKFERLLASRGILFPHYKHYLVATLYNTQTFSLCSFNHDDLWHKRMPCIGFFGNKKVHSCLYIQCLLNGFPFSSGAFHSIQQKEFLLGHVNFTTNRGYMGMSLDVSDTYKMTDLRIRLCIEGNITKPKITQKENKISIKYKNLFIMFSYLYAAFDNNEIVYELTTHDNKLFFDIILYHGNEIALELKKIEEAIVAFSLYMGEKCIVNFPSETYYDEKFLYTKTNISDTELMLKSHKQPDNYEVVFSQDAQYIFDTKIGTYIDKEETFTKHHNFFFENNNAASYLLRENNTYNKKILKKISKICDFELSDIKPEIRSIFKSLNNFSLNEIRHYSVLILHQLFALATKSNKRFIKLIETRYANIGQLVRTSHDKKEIKALILDTANQLYSDYKELQSQTSFKTTSIIDELLKLIHSEYTNPDLSLQNFALTHNTSESYISRKFSEYIGVSYVKYITQLRIDKALELLNNDPNITDIHIKCGYYNSQTFSTAFKKITGLTVKNYIKSLQRNN